MPHPIDRDLSDWPTWRHVLALLFVVLYLGSALAGLVLMAVHIVQWLTEVG